ncbi:MAG: DmsE family decaheme c-type cytochrome [Candidatus Aminicenantales bacterium]
MKKIAIYLFLSLSLLIFLGAAFTREFTESDFVGSEMCLECHDNIKDRVVFTSHFDLEKTVNNIQVEYCEACHGPGNLHVEDPEKKGTIRNFKDTEFSEVVDTCLACHKKNHFLNNFKREKHFQTGSSCLSCHSMHPEQPLNKLLSEQPEGLCFSCHQDKVSEFNLPYHHKVSEGRMRCWDCHNPHDADVSTQKIGFKKIDESCFVCHPSQRGPFTYEHIGTNIGTCTVCHSPHGSENARLLRRSSQYLLCLECHSGSISAESLLGMKTPSFHITSNPTYQNCTICHVKIHGSYLDHYFLR